jgi:hypothetical protein
MGKPNFAMLVLHFIQGYCNYRFISGLSAALGIDRLSERPPCRAGQEVACELSCRGALSVFFVAPRAPGRGGSGTLAGSWRGCLAQLAVPCKRNRGIRLKRVLRSTP